MTSEETDEDDDLMPERDTSEEMKSVPVEVPAVNEDEATRLVNEELALSGQG